MVHSLLRGFGSIVDILGFSDLQSWACIRILCFALSAGSLDDRQSGISCLAFHDFPRNKTTVRISHTHETFPVEDVGGSLVDRDGILYLHWTLDLD